MLYYAIVKRPGKQFLKIGKYTVSFTGFYLITNVIYHAVKCHFKRKTHTFPSNLQIKILMKEIINFMNHFNCNVGQYDLKIQEIYVTLITVSESLLYLNTACLYVCDLKYTHVAVCKFFICLSFTNFGFCNSMRKMLVPRTRSQSLFQVCTTAFSLFHTIPSYYINTYLRELYVFSSYTLTKCPINK
jgi:hypothetical protein